MLGRPVETRSEEPVRKRKAGSTSPALLFLHEWKADPGGERLRPTPKPCVRHYSYRRLSTGSSCEARVAGTVPKMIPTIEDTTIAMIADSPEIGMR